MEAFISEKKIKRNTELGRWLSLGGLGTLILGFVISLIKSELIIVSMTSLVIGFILSTVGAYFANRWTRTPRVDQVLTGALKGISNQYHLYHYLLPISHVLLGPTGIYVFKPYVIEGRVSYDGKRWRQKFNVLNVMGFTGQDALGDPVRESQLDVQRLHNWLRKKLPPETNVPDITPFVVFVRDKIELDIQDTDVPVLTYKQLKKRIRAVIKKRDEFLSEDDLYSMEQAILGSKIDEL